MGGRAADFLATVAAPAAWVYGKAIAARNARFDAGRGVQRIDRPVISVGNITVGGTGKSPMVLWVVRTLLNAGYRPAIAMRGYGARTDEKNDEHLEFEWRAPEVPVVAHPDRYNALCEFLATHGDIDCIALDDGFQHRQLHRDLDIVLIDAKANTMHDAMLPAGRLREPVQSLQRADAVVVTRAGHVDAELGLAIERAHGRPPIAWSQHRWDELLVIEQGNTQTQPVLWLDGKRVLTMFGVGNPESIEHQLIGIGANIAARIPARDHERYDRAKLNTARGLCAGVDAMVVTAKDWVKIQSLIDSADWPCPIVVPELEIDMHTGADDLRRLITNAIRR